MKVVFECETEPSDWVFVRAYWKVVKGWPIYVGLHWRRRPSGGRYTK